MRDPVVDGGGVFAGDGGGQGGDELRQGGGTPLNASNLLRDLRQLTEKAGIERITFHELRHTAGSLQLAENATMTTVSKNLGHSSVSVTAAVYAHAYAEDQREAVSAVARRLGRVGRKAEEREEREEE